MERVLTSYRFLAATAVCCGLSVAIAVWALGGASGAARALAGLIALLASLAVMLLIAGAASDETPPPPAVVVPSPPVAVEAPSAPTAPPPARNDVLARRLAEARGLREQLEPGAPDPRVDEWIRAAKAEIEGCRPGMSGYFNALARRAFADDRLRLDAYTRRLETIVRGY